MNGGVTIAEHGIRHPWSSMLNMIWTAWNNGKHLRTGAGYGLVVAAADRDRHFQRSWRTVTVELPTRDGYFMVEANVDKESFWGPTCRELISMKIGHWMLTEQYAPWLDGKPPKFEVEALKGPRFRIKKLLPA